MQGKDLAGVKYPPKYLPLIGLLPKVSRRSSVNDKETVLLACRPWAGHWRTVFSHHRNTRKIRLFCLHPMLSRTLRARSVGRTWDESSFRTLPRGVRRPSDALASLEWIVLQLEPYRYHSSSTSLRAGTGLNLTCVNFMSFSQQPL